MERRNIEPGSNRSRRERETYRGKTEKKIENGMKREERKRNHETKKMKREKR